MNKIEPILSLLFIIVLLVFSILRKRLNYRLYNSQYGTNFKPLGLFEIDSRVERLACEFHFFYFKVKPEDKRLAMLNNIMSVTLLGTILWMICWVLFLKTSNKKDYVPDMTWIYIGISMVVLYVVSLIRRKLNAQLFISETDGKYTPYEMINQNGSLTKVPQIKPFFYWKVKPENKTKAFINNILASITILYIIAMVIYSVLYFKIGKG